MAKAYPHIAEIKDPAVQQLVRLLWDKIGECEEKIAACEEVLSKMKSTASRVPSLARDVSRIQASFARFI